MAKPFLLSLSLCLLLFTSACLAREPRQSQFNECQLDSINALEPDNRIESEAGVTETWNANHPELRCAGVAVLKRIIDPYGLHLPSYVNYPQLIFIVQGKGVLGVAIPGCAETYEEPQSQSRQGRRGGRSQQQQQERHQKIRHFRQGDVIAIPPGIPYWTYNYGDEQLVAINLLDTTNLENQLDPTPRRFYLAGNPEEEYPETKKERQQQSPGGRKHGQHQQQKEGEGNNNVLGGFDPQFLAQAFNVDEETARKLQSPDDQRNQIVKVKGGLSIISPQWQQEEEEEEQQQGRGRRGRHQREGQRGRHGQREEEEEEEEEEEDEPQSRERRERQPGRRERREQQQGRGQRREQQGEEEEEQQQQQPGRRERREREQGRKGRQQEEEEQEQQQGRGQRRGQQGGGEEEEEEEQQQQQGRRERREREQGRRRQGRGQEEEEEEEEEQQSGRRQRREREQGRKGRGQQEEEEEEKEQKQQPGRQERREREQGRKGRGQEEEEEEEEEQQQPGRRERREREQGRRGRHGQGEEEEEEEEQQQQPRRRGRREREQGRKGRQQEEEEEEQQQGRGQRPGQQGEEEEEEEQQQQPGRRERERREREQGSKGRGQQQEEEEEEEEEQQQSRRERQEGQKPRRQGRRECEQEQERGGQGSENGLEETICTLKLHENIAHPARADLYNPRAGRISTINSLTLPILKWFQLSAEWVVLYRNAIYAPHWNINANSVIYATRGRGRVQVVNCQGNSVYNGEFRRGQLLVVPQNFVVAKQAGSEGLEYIAFKTNDRAAISPLVGRTSVIRAIPADVLANAFGLRQQQVSALKYNRNEGVLVSPNSESQEHRFLVKV